MPDQPHLYSHKQMTGSCRFCLKAQTRARLLPVESAEVLTCEFKVGIGGGSKDLELVKLQRRWFGETCVVAAAEPVHLVAQVPIVP